MNSSKIVFEEISKYKRSNLLEKCVATIEDLKQQLQQQMTINQEQKHLIDILKQGKQYYEQEYKNNSFEQEIKKLRDENRQINLLYNAHRKANNQIKEQIYQLEQKIAQKDRILLEKQQQIETIKLEKQILERQWNKVVKAVKKKIAKIVKEEDVNPEQKIYKIGNARNAQFVHKHSNQQFKGQDYYQRKDLTLKERSEQMIKILNQKLAVAELEQIFMESSMKNKDKENQFTDQKRKTENILRQTNLNVQSPFKVQFY